MILGMSLAAFTALHTAISLVAIAAGFVVVAAMIGNRRAAGWTALFLATTVVTSITGFMFPPKPIGPPHIFGVVSLVLLTAALIGLYGARLTGIWRPVYIVTALVSLYLNVVVLIVQSFQKIPFLNAFAPTGSEPPFMAAQGLGLLIFLACDYLALKRFRPEMAAPTSTAAA